MALLVADSSSRVTEARTLPAGTEVRVRAARYETAEPSNYDELSYRTMRPLCIRPIQIDKGRFEMRRVPGGGFLLHLGLRSIAPRSEDVRRIELYANPQGDVLSALRLHYALKNHLAGASYVFSTPRGPSTEPAPARLTFSPPREPFDAEPFAHPLERVRRALHFPLGSLCLAIDIDRTPPEWTDLTLVLRLAPTWPAGLVLGPGSFLLHATPMVNLRRELAEPIPFDGTKSRAAVAHPEPRRGYRPREILGVYESTPNGLLPLLPEPLAEAGEYYAIETAGGGAERRVFLDLRLPRAFAEPTTLVVEAEWYQPEGAGALGGALEAMPASRHLDGLRWQVASPVQPSSESPLEGRRDRLSRLLHWSSSRALDRKAIVFLLELHGAATDERWRRVLASIDEFSSDQVPDVRSKSGRKTVYRVALRGLPPTLRPSADFLFARLPDLLAAWTSNDELELHVHADTVDGVDVVYRPEDAGHG
jgi:type VI secretion system protein ImpG